MIEKSIDLERAHLLNDVDKLLQSIRQTEINAYFTNIVTGTKQRQAHVYGQKPQNM